MQQYRNLWQFSIHQKPYLLLLPMIRVDPRHCYTSFHRIPIPRDLIVNPSCYLSVVRNWRPPFFHFVTKNPEKRG